MINTLQSWRFLFALMIFMHHFAGDSFKVGGSCGVAFFMMLSGFVMAIGYSEKCIQTSFGYMDFYKKRLARLYPLHLLCLLVFIVIQLFALRKIEWFTLIPNLLLIQSWFPNMSYYFSGNAVSWCLSDMIFFYACFPLLIKGYTRCTKKVLSIALFALFSFYFGIVYCVPNDKVHAYLYISPIFRLLDFILGIMIFYLYTSLVKNKTNEKFQSFSYVSKTVIECLPIVLLLIFIFLFPIIPPKIYSASYYWLPMSLIILVFAMFNKSGGAISRFLSNRIIIILGEISFSFYMLHQLVIIFCNGTFKRFGVNMPWELRLCFEISITLIASFYVYHNYEKRCSSYLKNKFL